MAFTIPNGVTDVIKKLSNFPNRIDRLKATQLKAMFDQAAKNVQEDVKRLVSELGASTAAGNIGFARSTEVPADNVQDRSRTCRARSRAWRWARCRTGRSQRGSSQTAR